MEVVWDKEANVITVGKAQFTRYHNYKDWYSWIHVVVNGNGLSMPSGHPKDKNKKIADMLGCSPAQLFRLFQKLQYKVFVGPHKDILMKIGFSGRENFVRTDIMWDITQHQEVCRQVYNDGLYHLLPIVAVTGKSPQELKKEFGAKWKVIANNSLNKNIAVAQAYRVHRQGYTKVACSDFADLPTTVLKTYGKHSHMDTDCLRHITLHCKGKWSKVVECRDVFISFMDAQRMAEQLDKKVDYKWTPRRVKEEHDKMIHEINAKRYSPEPFECLQDIEPKILTYHDGYTAHLLMSAKEIADEGSYMGHCVGGYAEYVRNGGYLVYSIRKDGERSSTLGLYREEKKIGFNQHYRRFNEVVTNEVEKTLAEEVLALLNAVNKEEKLAA